MHRIFVYLIFTLALLFEKYLTTKIPICDIVYSGHVYNVVLHQSGIIYTQDGNNHLQFQTVLLQSSSAQQLKL